MHSWEVLLPSYIVELIFLRYTILLCKTDSVSRITNACNSYLVMCYQDKSKLDWEKYKAEQGITTELKNHANSKGRSVLLH